MNNERFNKIVEDRMVKCKELLLTKSKEYSRPYRKTLDRLSNFKRAGEWDEETPERALWGMCKKQLVSLRDFIYDLETNVLAPREQWEEKIGDCHNYLYLLEALVAERFEKEIAICNDNGRKLELTEVERKDSKVVEEDYES